MEVFRTLRNIYAFGSSFINLNLSLHARLSFTALPQTVSVVTFYKKLYQLIKIKMSLETSLDTSTAFLFEDFNLLTCTTAL